MHDITQLQSDIEALRSEFEVASQGRFPHKVRRLVEAATYTIQPHDELIAVDYAGAVTVTLPDYSGLAKTDIFSPVFYIKDESGAAGTNNITISGNGNNIIALAESKDVINPDYSAHASVVINSDYGVYALYFNGTEWHGLSNRR